ncbi:MAG: sulfoxide reductase heme-binding subunit YedZ [Pseudomonadales bacterium]|nr:sulfoxide reductase heme-binding subunit YedZ [Pseudomonadales bacterium]
MKIRSPWVVWALGCLPIAFIISQIIGQHLGPDPAKTLVNELGSWALRWLLLCLLITPLRYWTHDSGWMPWRRPLGLLAFVYAVLHFLAYVFLLFGADWRHIAEEIRHRPYILVGLSAWLLLLPLAWTSTRAWQKRLKARWVKLHQLVYPASGLAVLHGVWVQKLGIFGFWPYIAAWLGLMIVRIFIKLTRNRHQTAKNG